MKKNSGKKGSVSLRIIVGTTVIQQLNFKFIICLFNIISVLLLKGVDTEAEVVRRIVAIPGRALGRVRPIVGVTVQSRSHDQGLRKSRQRNRRSPTNPTRNERRKARTVE